MTKAGIANMVGSVAQLLAERSIRANSVAPGPIWTPLIPATTPPEEVQNFGQQLPIGRPRQPAEVAPVDVMLASDEASYISGARVASPEASQSSGPFAPARRLQVVAVTRLTGAN